MIAALLDINVVLDVFLARAPWVADSAVVLAANQRGEFVGHLSAASIPTIFYIVRRNADLAKALRVVTECLASFDIVPVDRKALELAHSMPGSDFEDNLQIACAVEAGLDAIVTRDLKGFAGSTVAVLTPAELLARISKAPHA
jgi:predicted nucleic acid-binding protein